MKATMQVAATQLLSGDRTMRVGSVLSTQTLTPLVTRSNRRCGTLQFLPIEQKIRCALTPNTLDGPDQGTRFGMEVNTS